MQIGIVHPGLELGGTKQALVSIGLAAETLGYDHFAMYDHVLGATHADRDPPLTGYATERDPFNDPFVAFGYLAAITQRIELVTAILILPQRQTALVAKQAVDVDLLSEGRLRLGVGLGWNYVEYGSLGQDFHTRGKRMDEQIPLLRRFWTEPQFSFDGRFDTIDRAGILPLPHRPIPIYTGGVSEPAYERGARLADGFIFFGPMDFCLSGLERVRHHLAEAGRAADSFGLHYVVPDNTKPLQHTLDCVAQWRDAGGTCVTVNSMGRGMTEADEHIDWFAQIKAKV
jgi:probable F420-dependent oxidoreductase